jgi:methionine aminopeptidase
VGRSTDVECHALGEEVGRTFPLNDVVMIDTGAVGDGYHLGIISTYVFGAPKTETVVSGTAKNRPGPSKGRSRGQPVKASTPPSATT